MTVSGVVGNSGSRTTRPSTLTRPAAIHSAATLREHTPRLDNARASPWRGALLSLGLRDLGCRHRLGGRRWLGRFDRFRRLGRYRRWRCTTRDAHAARLHPCAELVGGHVLAALAHVEAPRRVV